MLQAYRSQKESLEWSLEGMVSYLKIFAEKEAKNWSKMLKPAMFLRNNTYIHSIDMTPIMTLT